MYSIGLYSEVKDIKDLFTSKHASVMYKPIQVNSGKE